MRRIVVLRLMGKASLGPALGELVDRFVDRAADGRMDVQVEAFTVWLLAKNNKGTVLGLRFLLRLVLVPSFKFWGRLGLVNVGP